MTTDPLMQLSLRHGEGRLTYRALKAGGLTDVSAIAGSPARVIADRGHFSMRTAQRLKAGAREMLRKGLGGPAVRGRGGRHDGPSSRPGRRFSEGVTLQEASLLQTQKVEGRPPEPPRAQVPDPPAPGAMSPRESGDPARASWSFG